MKRTGERIHIPVITDPAVGFTLDAALAPENVAELEAVIPSTEEFMTTLRGLV